MCEFEQEVEWCYVGNDLVAKRHIPPTVPEDGVISPVFAKLAIMNPNNDNVQKLGSRGVSQYLAKYVAQVDESTRVFAHAPRPTDPDCFRLNVETTGNTKISSVNRVEKSLLTRKKKHHIGRAMTQAEAMMILCHIPQVYTNIEFVHISTTMLEERPGFEKQPHLRHLQKQGTINGPVNAISDIDTRQIIPANRVKLHKQDINRNLPKSRHFKKTALMLAQDSMFSPITLDVITIFGLRPPELYFIKNPALYFRWFKRETLPLNKDKERTILEKQIQMCESLLDASYD